MNATNVWKETHLLRQRQAFSELFLPSFRLRNLELTKVVEEEVVVGGIEYSASETRSA